MVDLKTLTYKELVNLLALCKREMACREMERPLGYRCCHCDFTSTHSIDVSDHLRKIHHYPEEDALYGAVNLYR